MSFPKYPAYKDSGVEWIGEIPVGWKLERLKCSVLECKNGIWGQDPQFNEDDITCIRVADFDREKLNISSLSLTVRNIKQKDTIGREVEFGDLLIEKSGGGEKQPVGCVVFYSLNHKSVCSNFIACMKISHLFLNKYLLYVHKLLYDSGVTVRSIKQTSGIQNLDQNSYLNEKVPVPPFPEQQTIASFLDRECRKIDALIAEQERLIALLAEKRQAVISHAVTKGLNSNVPMKDSGIPWIGMVPKGWEIKRIKDCDCKIVDCKNRTPENHPDGKFFVVRTSCIKDGTFNPESGYFTDEANFIEWTAKGVPQVGDVLFTREAPAGEACLAPTDIKFCLGQRMMFIRPPLQVLSSEFLLYSIYGGSPKNELLKNQKEVRLVI